MGLAIPPGALDEQHGVTMQQSIIQFIGQGMHAQPTHGFMHGSMHCDHRERTAICQQDKCDRRSGLWSYLHRAVGHGVEL